MTLERLRREYKQARLDETSVARDPVAQLRQWLDEAAAAELWEPNAMTLATASAGGSPSARTVLLKGVDPEGLVFYGDYRSRKARELEENPRACLLFYWRELERQIRIEGPVARLPGEDSTRYFETRPLGSRLGAWASHQSAVLSGGRAELEQRFAEMQERFADGAVPRPPHWGGYRLAPVELEFWQGRENRLHDRIRYRRTGDAWVIDRLSP